MSSQEKEQSGFKDPAALTKWTKWFLYAQMLAAVILIILGVNGDSSLQEVVSIISLIISTISAILILKWIYRANYNAYELGARNMLYTPGWSIGWYFIPIANLWKPYQAMKEIWKASSNPQSWKSQSRSSLLPWWWFLWIVFSVGSFLSQLLPLVLMAYLFIAADAGTSFNLEEITVLALRIFYITEVILIVLSLILIKIISGIYKIQLSHVNDM